MRTQVAIVGAGPAGLLLSHLLHLEGIESVVLESRSREHVEGRIRAGVLEHGTAATLEEAGVGDRMKREGIVHEGMELRFAGQGHRIPLTELTGKTITVYGQQEVVKDLISARLDHGGEIWFDTPVVGLEGLTSDQPRVRYERDGAVHELACDIVAGCDGYHGVSRAAIPHEARTEHERAYSVGWLGIVAEVPPSTDELIYAYHDRGFALHSLRSPTRSRLYIQCDADDDLQRWSDRAIWDELHTRLAAPGWSLREGPIAEKSIAPLRSFVLEPMRYGRLLLAGDAAHIVPPTGAKGLNLAVADIRVLHQALTDWFHTGSQRGLEEYSPRCLDRVWRVQHFSWLMTQMLHRFPNDDAIAQPLRLAQLHHTVESSFAAASLAEGYVGLPMP